MITTKQAAKKLGVTVMRIRQYLHEGRILGAVKFGRDWILPDKVVVKPPRNPRGRPRKRKEGKQ